MTATYGRTNFYIDGFNLYYGCLKDNNECKWLNLEAFCRTLYPNNEIHMIRYFTARVKPTDYDKQKPQRQEVYLRALETLECLSIHYGCFLSNIATMPLAIKPARGSRMVDVIKTEEKGSDVNLATYLLLDGFNKEYEIAVVVSNDSDLVEPMRVVRDELKLPVGVVDPVLDKKKLSQDLRQVATFYKQVRLGLVRSCQFPDTLLDYAGVITRPQKWTA